VTEKIKRWLKRRAVVELVTAHAKNEGLLGRNWLGARAGDRSNALLAAVGFNLRQLLCFLKRLELFLCPFLPTLFAALLPQEDDHPLLNTLNDSPVYS
jgi:IS5 family transposase